MTIIDIMLSHEIVTRKVSISAGLLGWLTSQEQMTGVCRRIIQIRVRVLWLAGAFMT